MYTLLGCIKHKGRDSYVLYIPRVHPFGLVLLTHTLLVQTHTHDVSAPWFCLENETMIQIQDMLENGKPDIVLKTVKGFYS